MVPVSEFEVDDIFKQLNEPQIVNDLRPLRLQHEKMQDVLQQYLRSINSSKFLLKGIPPIQIV